MIDPSMLAIDSSQSETVIPCPVLSRNFEFDQKHAVEPQHAFAMKLSHTDLSTTFLLRTYPSIRLPRTWPANHIDQK